MSDNDWRLAGLREHLAEPKEHLDGRPGDTLWCSDWTGRHRLQADLGVGDLTDEQIREVLRPLDDILRWTVEMTTGVRYGAVEDSRDFAGAHSMRDAGLGEPAPDVDALYRAGIAIARAELRARYPSPRRTWRRSDE
jgi:hypothetical protein